MSARTQTGLRVEVGVEISDPRALLECEVAKLTEAECREVYEYIEIMRSLRREGVSPRLFGGGFARLVPAMCAGSKSLPA
jgi:hypothetical protein